MLQPRNENDLYLTWEKNVLGVWDLDYKQEINENWKNILCVQNQLKSLFWSVFFICQYNRPGQVLLQMCKETVENVSVIVFVLFYYETILNLLYPIMW